VDGYVADATFAERIDALKDYRIQTLLDGNSVTLGVYDGQRFVPKVIHTFAGILQDGGLGAGTLRGTTRFDDFRVQGDYDVGTNPAGAGEGEAVRADSALSGMLDSGEGEGEALATDLRVGESAPTAAILFDEGDLGEPQQFDSNVLQLIRNELALPTGIEFGVAFNVQRGVQDRWSNALVVFDYHSPTDFKFAGAFVGIDRWAIGRMTERGYALDRLVEDAINFEAEYNLRLVLADGQVTLEADGVMKVHHSYDDSVVDGKLGLLSYDGAAEFTRLAVRRT
jgi:hypothetical protein